MSQPLCRADVLFTQRLVYACGIDCGPLDGRWGPRTDRAVAEFERLSSDLAHGWPRLDPRSERLIAGLQLEAQRGARWLLALLRDTGLDARVISGTRTYAEQDALYRQGRWGHPGPRVTNARGGESWHNFGVAWDIGLFEAGRYLTDAAPYRAAHAAIAGHLASPPAGFPLLEWGGAWRSFPDPPHWQLALGAPIAAYRARFERV